MYECPYLPPNPSDLANETIGYMEKGKFDKAFNALKRLRSHELQASRDMYYAFKLLEVEAGEREGKNLFKEFFLVRRNRRAAQSSFFVMFMQYVLGFNREDMHTS